MLETYKLVSLAMYEERRALDIWHYIYVAESIVYQVLECISCLLPHDIPDRHEWTHEKKRTRFTERCKKRGWAGTDGSAEEEN